MIGQESRRLTSLNARIANVAREQGHDPNRVRRQVAFHRFIARISDEGWVLKGGFCLEVRLSGQARATKDLDFVRQQAVRSEEDLLDELDDLLSAPAPDDGFTFEALSARPMRQEDEPFAWRVTIDVAVDGRHFSDLKLDLVQQFDEVAEAVEDLTIEPPVGGMDYEPVVVIAVDPYQHAAEKFHAMARIYAGERPSSRVKDLVDLLLLDEANLLPDRAALLARIVVVSWERDGGSPPRDLPDPPGDWAPRFKRLLADLDLAPTTVDDAFRRVHTLYHEALNQGDHQ